MHSRAEPDAGVRDLLRSVFGHHDLRAGQMAAITAALGGEDLLVVMPTGSGKSLCFQLPALRADGLTVVVSPLIAIMKDQVDALRAKGVAAAAINSLEPPGAGAATLRAAAQGRLQLLYVAPERLNSPSVRSVLVNVPPVRVVVDEAHCVIRWGHDFRPDYLGLADVLKELGEPPLTALTATATTDEQQSILSALDRPGARRIITGFDRPELYFAVQQCPTQGAKGAALTDVLARIEGPALVYCGTRVETEAIARGLVKRHRIAAAPYHAGLPARHRREAQDAFLTNRLRVVAPTSAFGMGVDKPDVRAVVHWTLPFDLTGYYQAAGRAGRDGNRALCHLLYSHEDRRLRNWQLSAAAPSVEQLGALFMNLAAQSPAGDGLDEAALAALAGLSPPVVRAGLATLSRPGIVRRIGWSAGAWTIVRPPRTGELGELAVAAAARRAVRKRALQQVIDYAVGAHCRRSVLLAHFGEEAPPPHAACCDRCYGVHASRRSAESPDGRPPRARRVVAPSLEPSAAACWDMSFVMPAETSNLDTRVLAAIADQDGRLTTSTLARTLVNTAREADASAVPHRADVRSAVDRLLDAGYLVVFHGAGSGHLALTRRGRCRVSGRNRVAENRAAYYLGGGHHATADCDARVGVRDLARPVCHCHCSRGG